MGELLDCLLSVAEKEFNSFQNQASVKEVNQRNQDGFLLQGNSEVDFINSSNVPNTSNGLENISHKTLIHTGETDSSDDESNKYFENNKYNDCGKNIKQMITASTATNNISTKSQSIWTNKNKDKQLSAGVSTANTDLYTDPVFGIRIVKPLISGTLLKERMVGRQAVSLAKLKNHIEKLTPEKDWVIAGVIVYKSDPKVSQKGTQFSFWQLSDLQGDLKTVSLFLFGNAHKQLWKTVVRTVVGILNPSILEKKSGSKDEATLSVDNPQKVMILGQSKDLGTCRSKKANGDPCTSFVNLNKCEYCVYHIKKEYQKFSQRSDLQSSYSGRGLISLRNKVLGKNEVFYAGKSYTAIPAAKSKKLMARDEKKLKSLSGLNVNSNNLGRKGNTTVKARAASLELNRAQKLKDLELLKKLRKSNDTSKIPQNNHELLFDSGKEIFEKLNTDFDVDNKNQFGAKHSAHVTLDDAKKGALSVIAKLKMSADSSEIKCTNSVNVSPKDKNDSNFIVEVKNKNECDLKSINTNLNSVSDHKKEIIQPYLNKMVHKFNFDKPSIQVIEQEKMTAIGSAEKHKQLTNECTFIEKNIVGETSSGTTIEDVVIDVNKVSPKQVKLSTVDTILKTVPKGNVRGENILNKTYDTTKKTFKLVQQNPILPTTPILSGSVGQVIDLNTPIKKIEVNKAKMNALKWVKQNGPIEKSNPMDTRGKKREKPIEFDPNTSSKMQKTSQENEFTSERFKKMMAATSKHLDLLEEKDNEEKDKYFNRLERKEMMEEKMSSTFKIDCKAVQCLQCKYTGFSASEKCKIERHPLKIFNAVKRFFKCNGCGNRKAILNVIPTKPCTNCNSTKWERTGMMPEKKVQAMHVLSIRGGEQKFMNSVINEANLNLMVPDE